MRPSTSTANSSTNATTGGTHRSNAGAGAGAGAEAHQSRDAIAELVGHSEATMNAAHCASVGKALFELNAKYLPASLSETPRANKIAQALIGYEKHVKEGSSSESNLAQAWRAFKHYLQGLVDSLDRVTVIVAGEEKTFVISPKEVFVLVYLATMDDEAYGEQGSVNHKARLETLDNALITLHDGAAGNTRCHLGVRNDLVGVLNHVYPGIVLADDATTFLLKQMQQWMNQYIGDQKAPSSLWLAWLRDGEVPKLEDGQREQLRKHLHTSMRQAGFNDEKALEDCMACIPDLSPGLGDNRHLYALNGFYEYQAEQAGNRYLARMASYLDKHWRLGDNTITQSLLDLLRVMKVRGLLEHSALIQAWDDTRFSNATLSQARQTVDQFLKGLDSDPLQQVPSLSSEAGKQLDRAIDNYLAYRRDQRLDWVENYFVHYFHAPDQTETIKRLFSSLFDEDMQAKLFYAGHELQTLLPNSADEVQLSVYQVNRIFLQGLLQSPEDWSAIFAERFGRVLAFVNNNFNVNTPSARLAGLRADSYPATFLNQLAYLHERYRYKHRDDAGAGEEKDTGEPSRPNDMPFYVPSCVCREDLSRVDAWLTKEAKLIFKQTLPAKLQKDFVIYQLIDALKAHDSETFTQLYQRLFGIALAPEQFQVFDTVMVTRRFFIFRELAGGLVLLNGAGVLTQDNFAAVLVHAQPKSLARGLVSLNEASILTPANIAFVVAHALPWKFAPVLEYLNEANILTQANFDVVLAHPALPFEKALRLLKGGDILTQANFDAVIVHAQPEGLARSLVSLNEAGILTPANFDVVVAHALSWRFASVLEYLDKANILTQANFDVVLTHLTLSFEEALKLLKGADILTQDNFTAVIAHADSVRTARALRILSEVNTLMTYREPVLTQNDPWVIARTLKLLNDAGILTQDNFAAISAYTYPWMLFFALEHLNEANILTQANFNTMAAHPDINVDMTDGLQALNVAGILTQANFEALAAHKSPWELASAFVLIANPDDLAQKLPGFITKFEVVLAHENPALIRRLVEAMPENLRKNVLCRLQPLVSRYDDPSQSDKQNYSVIQGYCYKYGCSRFSLFDGNRAAREAAIERLIFPEKQEPEPEPSAQTMQHKRMRVAQHK